MWYVDFEQIDLGRSRVQRGPDDAHRPRRAASSCGAAASFIPSTSSRRRRSASEGAIGLALCAAGERGLPNAATTHLDPPQARLVVHVTDGRDRFTPALAWLVEFPTQSRPIAVWKIFVDATTGAVLQYWNDVRECGDGDDDENECVAARTATRSS